MEANENIFTRQFWLLCASSVLFMASFNMIIPELPAYLDSIGGSDHLKYVISLFALAALISRPFSGILADKVGRIPIMIIGPVVCVVIGFAYPVAHSIGLFLLLRFLHGFSTGFKPTGTTAYLADLVPASKRGEAMGMLGIAGSMGMAAGPAIGSYIAQTFSLEIMFWASSATAALSIAVLLGMKESLPNPERFSFRLLAINPLTFVEPRVWLPSLIMFLTVFAFGCVLTLVPDYSDYFGVENRGLFFTFTLFASMVTRLFSGKASDRLGRSKVMVAGSLLLVVSMLILAFAGNTYMFFLGAVVFGISAGVNSPTLFAWTADLAFDEARAKAMSTMFIALEFGIICGGYIGAEIYSDVAANFKWSFIVCSFLAFAAFLISLRASMGDKKEDPRKGFQGSSTN